jgi:hypothetical protein
MLSLFLLIRLVKIEKSPDVLPAGEASPALHLLQFLTAIVAPTSLHKKRIEYKNLLFAGLSSVSKAPGQYLVISASGQNALNQRRIINMQEPADPAIKARPAIVVRGQLALDVQSNLIQHPPKKHKAAHLFGGMSET